MWRPRPKNVSSDPHAGPWATCDDCGFIYNLPRLRYKFQWQGAQLVNQRFLVCPKCYDTPAEFLRTITLPPDPDPVPNARPEPYGVDEGLMPLTTDPAYPGDPGAVVRDENSDYIGVEPT